MKKQRGGLWMRAPYIKKMNRRINRIMAGNGKIKGSGVTRPFINKRNRLMLGNLKRRLTKKQKGGFLGQLVAALAPIGIDLASKIIRKI